MKFVRLKVGCKFDEGAKFHRTFKNNRIGLERKKMYQIFTTCLSQEDNKPDMVF